jgi:peptidylprolyl isomerase
MTQTKPGDTVTVHYTGKLTDGTVFDSSVQRNEPLVFTLGAGQVIPGFEQAVVGMQPGETKQTTIASSDAYGEHNPELIFDVEREQLPADLNPDVGDRYQMRQPDGQVVIVTVQNVNNNQVTFDANHPLAGQDLTFDVELVSVQ